MINIMWYVIRSAHAVINDADRSPCGRIPHGELLDERPNGKSCEVCLRAVARMIGE